MTEAKPCALFQFERPVGSTLDEWRDNVRKTDLWRRGDVVLVWVSEADTCQIATLTPREAAMREALDAAWVEAKKMRNAGLLVGPYPNDTRKHAVWLRTQYHAGKRMMEVLKPARAALAAT